MATVDQLANESDDEISVGCPSPQMRDLEEDNASQLNQVNRSVNASVKTETDSVDRVPSQQESSKSSGVRSFSILDILNHRPSGVHTHQATDEEPLSPKPKSKERHRRRSSPLTEENNTATRIIRPWDYPQFIPPGFLHPSRCLPFPGPIPPPHHPHHHPAAFVNPLSLAAHPQAAAAFGFHPLHRGPFPLTALVPGSAVATPNRASSLSPYSGSSDVHDTDVDADDVSTSGSTSGSPLAGPRPSSSSNATSKDPKGHVQNPKNGHPSQTSANGSPLDALFQMTSKTFEGSSGDSSGGQGGQHGSMLGSRQQLKKKRKSRTAFTNHQIFELEKRFLYQKYLSPADRDEIALSLGLSNAQVITWFQNRRAKLKRDMEELKKDVESAKILATHKGFVGTMAEMTLLQKKAEEYNKSISARD